MKLLIRSKLAFHARQMIIDILKMVITYELNAVDLKNLIDSCISYRITQEDHDKLLKAGNKVFEGGH